MKGNYPDQTDLNILRIIQADADVTNIALAGSVDLSAPPCLRRVAALETAGFIRGYRALLDPDKLGFGVSAIVRTALKVCGDKEVRRFIRDLSKWDLVREAYQVDGEGEFILKCLARDTAEFGRFVKGTLEAHPNVRMALPYVVGAQVKDAAWVPL